MMGEGKMASVKASGKKRPGVGKRILKVVGVALLCLAALVVALMVLLQLSPVRKAILLYALPRASRYIPGELTAAEVAWPQLGTLKFMGVSYMDDDVNVLSADTLIASVRIWPLMSKDMKARQIVAHGLSVDVPALRNLFRADTAAVSMRREPAGFPRPGVVPGLPSVAIEQISIRAPSIRVSEDAGVADLVMIGGFDFSYGGSGTLRIERLEARSDEQTWRIDELNLTADLDEGTLTGEGTGDLRGGYPVVFSVESPAPDEFKVVVASEKSLAPPEDPGVLATLNLERANGELAGIGFDIEVRVPPPENVSEVPALAWWLEGFPMTEGIMATIVGRAALKPEVAFQAHTVFREPTRLDRGMVAVRYEKNIVTVDSLSLAFKPGVIVTTAAEIETGEDILVSLEPIMLQSAFGDEVVTPTAHIRADEKTGTIVYSTKTRALTIEEVQVEGDFGQMTLAGQLDRELEGWFDLIATWSEPPAPLYRTVKGRPGLADSLKAAWAEDAPYSVRLRTTLITKGDLREMEGNASIYLPGPRAFEPLLPAGADLEGLGPLAGDLDFKAVAGGTHAEFDLDLDLGPTEWVDSSAVVLRGHADSIEVEEFFIEMGELRLAVAGKFNMRTRTANAVVNISDAGFLRSLSQSVPDFNLTIEGNYAAAAEGDRRDKIYASLYGDISGAAYTIPSVACTLSQDDSGIRTELRLPEGLVWDYARLDLVEARLASRGDDTLFPVTVAIGAVGEKYEYRQVAEVDVSDSIVCTVDTLRLVAYGNALEAPKPFRVSVDKQTRAFAIEQMDLKGPLGDVSVDGFGGPEGMNLKCAIALNFPESPPPGLGLPKGAWPRRLDANVDIPAVNYVEIDATVEGFMLDDGTSASLAFTFSGGESTVVSTVKLDTDNARVVDGTLSLPAGIRAYPPGLNHREGDLSLAVRLDGYPLLVLHKGAGRSEAGNLVALVDADVQVAGPARAPTAYVAAEASFPDSPELADFSVVAEAALRSDSPVSTVLASRAAELGSRVARALGIESAERLAAEFAVRQGQQSLLAGHLSYPVDFKFDPPTFAKAEGRLDLKVKSDELPLEDIDILLPPEVGLDGTFKIDIAASGPADDPSLSGTVDMVDLGIKYQQILSLLLRGTVKIDGTAMRPALTGDVTVLSSIINLPESPRELHPVEGPSILLDTAWRATIDSLEVGPPRELRAAYDEPLFKPNYDIRIDISRGCWLRGEGLEVEFEGRIQVTQRNNKPVLEGELIARRGTFLFLGRVFDLERGTISFFGEEELNPSLNITVTSAIENYTVMITLGGTLEKPELTLTSVPDLPEGDIMAMILFGKPLEDLNEGQGSILKDRTADVLITMGAAKLQQSLAGQGGIDIVSVRSARGEADQGTALVVGTYITPDLLVSYEQALKEKSTSYIVLEYMLTRYVKLETLYSNQNRSGVGISAEKDY